MADVGLAAPSSNRSHVAVQRIDCDVHLGPVPEVLLEYRTDEARQSIGPDLRRLSGRSCYVQLGEGVRQDAWGPGGEAPGTHRATVTAQLLGDAGVDFALMTP